MEFACGFIGFLIGMAIFALYVVAAPSEKVIREMSEKISQLKAQINFYENQSAEQVKIDSTAAEYNKSLQVSINNKLKQRLELEKEVLKAQAELTALNEILAERRQEFFGEVPSKGGALEDNSKN